MRYAIISDIHSNLHALNTALDIISGEKIDSIICLGDIIGYNANPIECINAVKNHPLIRHIIIGNHDSMGVRIPNLSYTESSALSSDAMAGLDYSYSVLNDEDKEWLLSHPKEMVIEDPCLPFYISHESPAGDEYNWGYILNNSDAWIGIAALRKYKMKLGFFGHTHLPTFISSMKSNPLAVHLDMGSHLCGDTYKIDLDCCLINPGSIGQPRSGGKTSFAIFDSETRTVNIQDFDYDINGAQETIRKAKYYNPDAKERLAKRLRA